MKRELVEFKSGPFVLRGTWDWPDEAPSGMAWPGVILCHGFTGNRFESKRAYARLGAVLAKEGIACFRFDHRGCGESDGDFLEFSADGIPEDLDAAYRIFDAEQRVSKDVRAVVGYSLGGPSASYLASRHSGFRTAVLWAPVARPDIIKERFSNLPGFETYETQGFYDYGGYRVSRSYLDMIGTVLKPLDWIATFNKPILICHGDADEIVRPEQADLYMAARRNPSDILSIFAGADHGFSTADSMDAVIRQSAEWIQARLLGGA